jgi:hypothetical protein
VSTITNSANLDDADDPQECPDCLVDGQPCRYHQGWADGWDQAANVVGALVLEQRRADQ